MLWFVLCPQGGGSRLSSLHGESGNWKNSYCSRDPGREAELRFFIHPFHRSGPE
jgi:hypothetical protein